jgi:hypothetical protein
MKEDCKQFHNLDKNPIHIDLEDILQNKKVRGNVYYWKYIEFDRREHDIDNYKLHYIQDHHMPNGIADDKNRKE